MSTATKNNTDSDFKSFERDQDAAIDLLERAPSLVTQLKTFSIALHTALMFAIYHTHLQGILLVLDFD